MCKLLERILSGLCRPQIRMIPVIGPVLDQKSVAKPTPKFFRRQKYGVLLAMFEMNYGQFTVLSVEFVDDRGRVAAVDGVPQWLTDNPAVVGLEPAADGLSCKVSGLGPIGTAKVTMLADAKFGPEVEELAGTFDVSVTSRQATTVNLTATPPQDQPV